MSQHQQPKKHHFVPQCYLKNFTQENQFYVLDVRKAQKGYKELPMPKHTGQICYFNNYYTIDENIGSSQFRLDTFDALYIEIEVLSRLENRYGKIFDKLSTNTRLSLQDAINVADFIIQLKLRNPYWMRETLEKKKDSFIDSAMDSLESDKFNSNPRFQHMPMELKQAVANWVRTENKANPKFSKQMQLFSLIQRNLNQETRNEKFRLAIIDCKWMIYQTPENGPYFITSDNPGHSLKGNDGLTYNTNFTDPFMFFFPISPKLCLVIGGNEKDFVYSNKEQYKQYKSGLISSDLVIAINNSSMQCVNSLLIAVDKWYLSQIAVLNNPNAERSNSG
jgi:hypothetical protein